MSWFGSSPTPRMPVTTWMIIFSFLIKWIPINLHGSHDCILGGGVDMSWYTANLEDLQNKHFHQLENPQNPLGPSCFSKSSSQGVTKIMQNQPYLNWLGSIDLVFWGEGSGISKKNTWVDRSEFCVQNDSLPVELLPYIRQNSWTCHANVSCKLCQSKFIDHLQNVWPNW